MQKKAIEEFIKENEFNNEYNDVMFAESALNV